MVGILNEMLLIAIKRYNIFKNPKTHSQRRFMNFNTLKKNGSPIRRYCFNHLFLFSYEKTPFVAHFGKLINKEICRY